MKTASLTSRYLTREEFELRAKDVPNTAPLLRIADVLFTGMVRGTFLYQKCYSIQGVYPLDNDIADSFMISDARLLKLYPLAAHRSAKAVIQYAFKEFGFKRIHITVPNDFHVRWCKSIGFTPIDVAKDRVSLVILP